MVNKLIRRLTSALQLFHTLILLAALAPSKLP